MSQSTLEQTSVPTGIKLALMWASLMFLYIYNDYFSLYVPGILENMAAGRMGPQGVEIGDAGLVAVSLLLAVPALMIFLSAVLPASAGRWLNIVLGVFYTLVEVGTLFVFPDTFFRIVVGIEIVVTLLIVWTAWRWPRGG